MSRWQRLVYAFVFAGSGAGLLFERFWHAFWPALSVLACFAGCALLGVFAAFGPGFHLALLLSFAAALSYAAAGLGSAFRFPRGRDIRRAVELESGFSHRPLEALLDSPLPDTPPEARALWDSYQQRLLRLRAEAKSYRPRPDAARADPYGLRVTALVLLLAGLAVAQGESGYRLKNALRVDLAQWAAGAPAPLDVWITPPAYTAENPVFLATTTVGAARAHGPVTVPEGSILKIRVGGVDYAPSASYAEAALPEFTAASAHSFTLETPLKQSGKLKIRKHWFGSLGAWDITVTPDQPPEITLIGTEAGDHAGLKIKYHVSDDYGVTKISGGIEPAEGGPGAKISTPAGSPAETSAIDFEIPLPDDPKKPEQLYTADLAAHPLAGSEVLLTLSASDAAGHVTTTAPKKIVLPERKFNNPVAQKIIAQRKRLIHYDNLLTEHAVMNALIEIADQPVNYHGDLLVFLGLDMAAKRLGFDGGPEAVQSVITLLWDLAVRVEDGGLSLASRELSDALQKLSEALRDKSATKEQIQALMDQVRQKMREYVQSLQADMRARMQDGKQAPSLSPELTEQLMKRLDLDKLMQQMRDLSQGTEREQMQKMAQFLKDTVDNYDPEKMQKMQEAQRKAIEALNQLHQLIQRQQALLDRTNKMSGPKPEQQPGQQQPPPQQADQDQPEQNQDQQNQDQQNQNQQNQNQHNQPGQNQDQQDQEPQIKSGQNQDNGPQPGQDSAQQQDGGQQSGQQSGQQGGQPQAGGQQQAGGGQQQAGGAQPQPGGQQPGGQQPGTAPGVPTPGLPAPGIPSPGTGQQPGGHSGNGTGQQAGQQSPGSQSQQDQLIKRALPPGSEHSTDLPDMTVGQQGQPGGKMPQISTPQQGAAEQGAIRGKLGDLLRGLPGDVPDAFTKADQAMKQAQQALKDGDPRGSAPQQKQALEDLQKAENEALEQMARSMQMMLSMGMGPGSGEGGYGEGYDPLGRGGNPDQNVKLPAEKERRRVQQIIEELRTRSNDYQRPKVERDYIDRLLDQFE
jgi:uncharacterized protein (TIGR02302 family)